MFFYYINDIHDEPARPGPARLDPARHLLSLTGHFSICSKDTNSKFQSNVDTGFEIVVSNLQQKIFINF